MNERLRGQLLSACFRFLIPVARFLLNAGVTYREFEELAKRAFVVVASKEYGIRGRDTSLARVSVMTGLGRKEVSRMRRESRFGSGDARDILSPLADLVSTWCSDPDWVDSNGSPKALPYFGSKFSFAELVAQKVGDRPIGAVQRELERIGAVDFTDELQIRLLRPHLIPTVADERLISALSYSLRALAETIAHNCAKGLSENETRIERFVESGGLSADELVVVRRRVFERLSELTEEFDQLMGSDCGEKSDSARRVGVGFYYSE